MTGALPPYPRDLTHKASSMVEGLLNGPEWHRFPALLGNRMRLPRSAQDEQSLPTCWRPKAVNLGGTGAEPLLSQPPAQPSSHLHSPGARGLSRKTGFSSRVDSSVRWRFVLSRCQLSCSVLTCLMKRSWLCWEAKITRKISLDGVPPARAAPGENRRPRFSSSPADA